MKNVGTSNSRDFLNELNGRWVDIYHEIDGHAIIPGTSQENTTIMEFIDGNFKIEQNGVVEYQGTFSIGSGKADEIVLIYEKSKNPLFLGAPRPGVFQLEGDTFKYHLAAVGHSAPEGFNSYPGSESVVSVYVRESAKDGMIRDFSRLKLSHLKSVALW